jgi:hypothetical protein
MKNCSVLKKTNRHIATYADWSLEDDWCFRVTDNLEMLLEFQAQFLKVWACAVFGWPEK